MYLVVCVLTCITLHISDRVFPILSYVWEEAPVAYWPVVPDTQDKNDDSQPVWPLTGIPRNRTTLCWKRGPKAKTKKFYDCKVGAIDLWPADCMLVHLDAFPEQRRKLKNRWGDDLHMVVTHVTDGITAYVVKNERTGKRKVLHRARLLLWLADYGELVRWNLINISDSPPGPALDQHPHRGSKDGDPVLGCSLQYGLDLTVYWAVIEDLEHMSSRLGHEVHVGAPRDIAGQGIVIHDEEEECPECLGSYSEDVPCSWAYGYLLAPFTSLMFNQNSWGKTWQVS